MSCQHENGASIRFGAYEIDPCEFEEVERHANVTVSILRCPKCGKISIGWLRQEDTIDLEVE